MSTYHEDMPAMLTRGLYSTRMIREFISGSGVIISLNIRRRDSCRHYDWLALPHDVEANPNEAVVRESFTSH